MDDRPAASDARFISLSVTLIQEVVELMCPTIEAKNLAFNSEVSTHLPADLRGDDLRLRRILLHLISNAVKFTHHGEIRFLAEGIERTKHACTLRIAVKDTGIGIAPEQQSLLFLPFSRLHPAYEGHYPGAGLGLALVKQLLDDLSGRIECTSQPGQGSVFTCFLPLRRVIRCNLKPSIQPIQNPVQLSSAVHFNPPQSRWQVLYVEDQPPGANRRQKSIDSIKLRCRIR